MFTSQNINDNPNLHTWNEYVNGFTMQRRSDIGQTMGYYASPTVFELTLANFSYVSEEQTLHVITNAF